VRLRLRYKDKLTRSRAVQQRTFSGWECRTPRRGPFAMFVDSHLSSTHGERSRVYDWSSSLPFPQRYYTEYGLAIRGLIMHHQIDRACPRCLVRSHALSGRASEARLLTSFIFNSTRL
jgi:hypothetical protein